MSELDALLASLVAPVIVDVSTPSVEPTTADLSALLSSITEPIPSPSPLAPSIPSHEQLQSLLLSMAPPPAPELPREPSPEPIPVIKSRETMNFADSISLIASMINSELVEDLNSIKNEQEQLELKLFDERKRLEREMSSKGINALAIKANLKKWDLETIKKWQKLRSEQQKRLQFMGIPGFFETVDSQALKRQAQIMQVLVGYMED